MLLTKQQKYLLAVLEKLGCAEQRQLAALLQKTFAFSSIDDAVRVTNACVRQMQMGGLLQISDNIVSHCGERAVSQQIEAIDVAGAVRGAAGEFLCRRQTYPAPLFAWRTQLQAIRHRVRQRSAAGA